MAISWVAKKKLTYLGGLLLIILIPVAFVVWSNWPRPSCADKIQNQNEEGVDCGGPCTPCVAAPVDLVTHWARPFKIAEGKYDVGAMVENQNPNYVIKNLDYQFKVYDDQNILISQIKGSTFVNAQEKFLILATNIDAGFRVPAKVFLELAGDYPQRWEYFKKDKLNLSIISKNFTNDPFAKLDVQIKNNSLSAIPNLEAEVVFYDKDGNAFASSVSKAGDVLGDSTQTISFAWPNPFPAVPELSEVYFRTDLTK